jgi:hypothetical protein
VTGVTVDRNPFRSNFGLYPPEKKGFVVPWVDEHDYHDASLEF